MQCDTDWSELEHSLVTSWRLDTLAVQADLLQKQGDPRGELMDLDLEFLHPNNPLTNEGLWTLGAALHSPLAPSQALFHLVWGR
jgi:hypothetical protein